MKKVAMLMSVYFWSKEGVDENTGLKQVSGNRWYVQAICQAPGILHSKWTAVVYYLEYGRSITRAVRALGYHHGYACRMDRRIGTCWKKARINTWQWYSFPKSRKRCSHWVMCQRRYRCCRRWQDKYMQGCTV